MTKNQKKKRLRSNRQTASPPFSDVYAPEGHQPNAIPFGRHRQALIKTQHPPMVMDENHNERVPCTLVPECDQNYGRDNPALSHNNNKRTKNIQAQKSNTTRVSWSTETRENRRAKATPKTYTDFFIHQSSDPRTALWPVGTRAGGTKTHTSQQQISSRNIRATEVAADGQHNSQQESSKKINFQTYKSQKIVLFRRLRIKTENQHQTTHTHTQTQWELKNT